MRRMSGVDLQRGGEANAGGGTSKPGATSRFGLRIRRWIRQVQRQGNPYAGSRGMSRGTGAALTAAATSLAFAWTVSAETFDSSGSGFEIFAPPVTTLVTNIQQSSGSSQTIRLFKDRPMLFQGFRTGPSPGGYELESISLYVHRTHEGRLITINADLYTGLPLARFQAATLTRAGNLNDLAHNEWQAPANTYLEPDTDYIFALDCVAGCANDNHVRFGTTSSHSEDSRREKGWSIRNYAGFRNRDNPVFYSDYNQVMRIRIKGRPSLHRAYETEIISTRLNEEPAGTEKPSTSP